MKKIYILLVLLLTAVTSVTAEALPSFSDHAYIEAGLVFTPGLVYNRSWDPGYNGTAIKALLGYKPGRFFFESGFESGYSYNGFDLFFPQKAGMDIAQAGRFTFYADAELLPGLLLTRPSPYFLFAAELAAGVRYTVSDRIALALYAGPRYTTAPGYSSTVADLEELDISAGFSGIFKLDLNKKNRSE